MDIEKAKEAVRAIRESHERRETGHDVLVLSVCDIALRALDDRLPDPGGSGEDIGREGPARCCTAQQDT